MVRREMARTRSEAQRLIDGHRVLVRGIPTPKPASLVSPDTPIEMADTGQTWVSRGALKLLAALDGFGVDVIGKRVLDVGASTGGFTEVALASGAEHVVALDVGRGQLHESLRSDPRVTVMEQTNFRHVDVDDLGRFPLVVGDLSFISLCAVARKLFEVGERAADYILLVKPQFEAGRGEVGRGGIVKDPVVRASAVNKVVGCLGDAGLGARELIVSPIKGADGNVEYLLWLRKGAETVDLEVPE